MKGFLREVHLFKINRGNELLAVFSRGAQESDAIPYATGRIGEGGWRLMQRLVDHILLSAARPRSVGRHLKMRLLEEIARYKDVAIDIIRPEGADKQSYEKGRQLRERASQPLPFVTTDTASNWRLTNTP